MIKCLHIIVLTLCVSDISNYHTEKSANFGQYNYVVSIWRNNEYLCSGTIINARHILTRAFCINNIPISELSIIAGTLRTDDELQEILQVKYIHIHYDYAVESSWPSGELRWRNDIAVLQLQHELIEDAHIGSGLLAGSVNTVRSDACKVTGWKLMSKRPSTYCLIWIQASILTDEACELHEPLPKEKCLSIDTKALVTLTTFNGNPVICNNLVVGMITNGKNNRATMFLDLPRYSDFISNAIDDGKTDVTCGQEPYIVSIWDRGLYKCGGIIITDIHILTSAHCILSTEIIDLRVVTGQCQVLPRNRRIEWLLVDRIRIDCISSLAILTIKQRLIWDPVRMPAALPSVLLSVLGVPTMQTCEVFRWHRAYDIDGETLMQLVRTSEKILSDQECRDSGVHLEENQFCTTGLHSHHSANIENIGNPIVCAGMMIGILIPTDTNSDSPSRFTRFLKIAAYIETLSAITKH